MERRRLGSSGPQISVVGYGTWEAGGDLWGEPVAEREVIRAIEAGLDAGINWIDTAEAYGDGRSEEIVGAVVRRRPDVMVFTKVAHFASGARPEDVARAIRGSLRRLGRDHVDLYQIHWPFEERVPVEETWGAMARVQDEGLARFIGVSNFDRPLIERCLAIRHVDSVQNEFSLLAHHDRADLLPWFEERGIGYLAYGPLAFGLLTGAFTPDTTFHESDWRSGAENLGYYERLFAPGRFEEHLRSVDRLRPIADRVGLDLPTLSLRAAIDTPGVTAVIVGTRKEAHARSNAGAGNVQLDEQTLRQIRDVVGLPGHADRKRTAA